MSKDVKEKNENKKDKLKVSKSQNSEIDKKKIVDKYEETSEVEILPEVIASIASVELDKMIKIERVGSILESLGSKKNKGIKVEFINPKEVKIDINILVEYGVRIPDVAFEIQKAVKNSVEAMTGLRIQEVNVHVQGIKKKEDENN